MPATTTEVSWVYKGEHFKHDHSAIIRAASGEHAGEPVATALDFNRFDRDEEVEANAKLIAAAPDLYYCLHELVHRRPAKNDTIWQIARAALGKVKPE